MKPYEKLFREALQCHAQALYPNTHELTKIWNDEHWAQLNQRIYNLADLMRNIQQGFARWFNKNHNRRGRFWADRFKSTILYGEKSLVDVCRLCIQITFVLAWSFDPKTMCTGPLPCGRKIKPSICVTCVFF